MKVKSFKGLIADGEQQTIRLSTNNGLTGYKIVKFQMMAHNPGTENNESTMKIYKTTQTTVDNTIDFSDNTLLGAGYYSDSSNENYGWKGTIVFDNEVFNQDIHITHIETVGSKSMNFYLELEQVKLDMNAATVATLKDMRAGPDTNFGP